MNKEAWYVDARGQGVGHLLPILFLHDSFHPLIGSVDRVTLNVTKHVTQFIYS